MLLRVNGIASGNAIVEIEKAVFSDHIQQALMSGLRSSANTIHIYDSLRSLRIWAKSDGIYSGRHENDFAPNAVAERFDTLTVIKKHNIELLKKTQEVTIRVHLRKPNLIN